MHHSAWLLARDTQRIGLLSLLQKLPKPLGLQVRHVAGDNEGPPTTLALKPPPLPQAVPSWLHIRQTVQPEMPHVALVRRPAPLYPPQHILLPRSRVSTA